MHVYSTIFGHSIPSYGLMITIGLLLANVLACYVIKTEDLDMDDFIILECYGILGAVIGAKLLYIVVTFKYIDWTRLSDPAFLTMLMAGGFIFYGGLIGGLLAVYGAGRLHRIAVDPIIRKTVFLIPFVHAFGRTGCFMAGCCFGIPYAGKGAVVYPEGAFAPAGVKLFPVQIAEAVILMMISFTIYLLQRTVNWYYTVETYLFLYGAARFILEYFRYDAIRGSLLGLSTSQWISIGMVVSGIAMVVSRKKRKVNKER